MSASYGRLTVVGQSDLANQQPTSPAVERPVSTDQSLDDAMRIDRFRLRRAQKRLSPDQFQKRLAKSVAATQLARAATPRIEYPADLPISAHRDELVELIRHRQVIVVCGETGSGKSTQLPKFCLEAGLGRDAMIGHTQPRRLGRPQYRDSTWPRNWTRRWASRSDTRFASATRRGDETLVKLMTDGILLAETQSDRFLGCL